MTSCYAALRIGLIYAGREDLIGATLKQTLENPEIKIIEGETISQFGVVHEDCTMLEFNSKNKNNEPIKVRIASTKYRDGFDLWLINPDSGASVRT